ncbi:SixA phosphatase family protein [Calditerrivibrio sp.]|uniref:SixA phosphatase family protein n=1 Tax=Calditerrivibrio sp. TaxID=2792612 RepID=UPI003D0BE629
MKVYFIRHAIAMEREEWQDDDLKRPLTKDGIKKFKSFFKKISKNLKKPDLLIASEAERSIATAKIIAKLYDIDYKIDNRINPGSDIMQYKLVLDEMADNNVNSIAIVGHEPDLSNFISFYIAETALSLKLKKGAIVCIKDKVLYGLIQPDMLK